MNKQIIRNTLFLGLTCLMLTTCFGCGAAVGDHDQVRAVEIDPAVIAALDADYYIDYAGGTIPLGDLPIGARVVDPSWEWEHRLGYNYSDETWGGEPVAPGESKPVTWVVVSKNHYDLEESHVTLLADGLVGYFTFDDSTDRGCSVHGNEYWEISGTTDATSGLRPWLNSTGIHAEEGFYRAFSEAFAQAVLLTPLPNLDGEGFHTTEDFVFIPSAGELGSGDKASPSRIGKPYAYFTSSYDQLRSVQAETITDNYWTRSPAIIFMTEGQLSGTGIVQLATPCGALSADAASFGGYGVRPALNLKSATLVTEIIKPEQEAKQDDLPQDAEPAEAACAPKLELNLTTNQLEPFDATEYELESIGVTREMTVEEAIDKLAWLGPPVRVEEYDHIRESGYRVYYDNFSILFRNYYIDDETIPFLHGYEIFKPGIAGIRGLEVGDSVEKVLNSFLITNVTPGIWKNPDTDYRVANINCCLELYFMQERPGGRVKTGNYNCDETTGSIVSIRYAEYLPGTCGYSGVLFELENGEVTRISCYGF